MEYIIIIISAVLVNNIVLAKFLGICPFMGVSNKLDTSIGMGIAVIFVMILSTTVTFILHKYVLSPLNLEFLKTISFILVIAALVQTVEIILKKTSPSLYQALGIFLPLITTNCTILGVALLTIQKNYNIAEAVVFSASNGLGFTLALIIFSSIREQIELSDVPETMKGIPIAFVTAGLLAMAFMGFANIVK